MLNTLTADQVPPLHTTWPNLPWPLRSPAVGFRPSRQGLLLDATVEEIASRVDR
jgi:hypothetical protein